MALSRVSAASVAAQDGPVKVSIVNKEMTPDEIVAAIQSEGEVNVGNWTYTANDTLIAKFKEHVSSTYGVDITLNYQASQAPSTYHHEPLHGAAKWQPAVARRDGDRGKLSGGGAVAAGTGDARSSFRRDWCRMPTACSEMFQAFPTAVGFQASATPASSTTKSVRRTSRTGQDLADERLKGPLDRCRCQATSPWRACSSGSPRPSVSTTKSPRR